MPYIAPDRRPLYDEEIEALQEQLTHNKDEFGDLNYVLSRIVGRVWKNTPRYWTICKIMGTLFCVAIEFYLRVARGYEDKAITKSGDIPEYIPEQTKLVYAQCACCVEQGKRI